MRNDGTACFMGRDRIVDCHVWKSPRISCFQNVFNTSTMAAFIDNLCFVFVTSFHFATVSAHIICFKCLSAAGKVPESDKHSRICRVYSQLVDTKT